MMDNIDIRKIKGLLTPLFRTMSVEKAIMFGSGARGTQTRKSDLDLVIVLKTDKRFFERYEDFEEIHNLVKGCRVDLLIYSPDELKRISHRKFIKSILSEGKVIYEH